MLGFFLDKQALFILGIPIWIILRILIVKKRKLVKVSARREFLLGIFAIYIFSVLSVTLFPLHFISFSGLNINRYINVNLIPFSEITRQVLLLQWQGFSFMFRVELMVRNVGGNLILLAPLGLFLPLLWPKFRSFKNCILFGILTSVSIEVLQLIETFIGAAWGRVTDIDDVILNTIGVIAGFFTYRVIYRFYMRYII
jgi:glycopeptide antibiotics resistance protein